MFRADGDLLGREIEVVEAQCDQLVAAQRTVIGQREHEPVPVPDVSVGY